MSDIESLTKQVKAQRLQILLLVVMEKAKTKPWVAPSVVRQEIDRLPLADSENPSEDREAMHAQFRALFAERFPKPSACVKGVKL
jgi:hypothetical protein